MRLLSEDELATVGGAIGIEPLTGEEVARNLKALLDSVWAPAIMPDRTWIDIVPAQ